MAYNAVPQGAEMSQLRQEAIRRAREMQARAQIPVPPPTEQEEPLPEPAAEVTPSPPQAETPPPQAEQAPAPRPRQENRPPQQQGKHFGLSGPNADTLDFLTKDPERAMILLLLLILMEEKADNSLLFAMMYLMS